MPILEPNPRILITGSDIHHGKAGGKPDPYWDDENLESITRPLQDDRFGNRNGTTVALRAYSTSKLAVIYLAHQFARENPDVKFLVYHPGWVPATGLIRELNFFMKGIVLIIDKLFQLTGVTMTSLGSGKLLAKYMFEDDLFKEANNVLYSEVGKVMKSSDESYNESREKALWNYLTELY